MKPKGIVSIVLGVLLAALGIVTLILNPSPFSVIPLFIGIALALLGWCGGRTGLIIFGHACIVIGCFLITWGIYLLPYSEPTITHIFARPLFWGLFSLFGGICANYHGFCKCIRK